MGEEFLNGADVIPAFVCGEAKRRRTCEKRRSRAEGDGARPIARSLDAPFERHARMGMAEKGGSRTLFT